MQEETTQTITVLTTTCGGAGPERQQCSLYWAAHSQMSTQQWRISPLLSMRLGPWRSTILGNWTANFHSPEFIWLFLCHNYGHNYKSFVVAVLGPHLAGLKVYCWLCAQGLLWLAQENIWSSGDLPLVKGVYTNHCPMSQALSSNLWEYSQDQNKTHKKKTINI